VTSDWRAPLLQGATRVEVPAAGRDPGGWPGYSPRPAVTVWRLPLGAVAAAWDFSVFGGSFGEDDATALVAAADLARSERVPLLTLVRSGGTRLQEGMAALVGIPRARLALLALADAGLLHVSVADVPTTGGVWISVAAAADLRVAVEGATVGFAGPRVVEAVTGALPEGDSHTSASAARAGLVDAVLPGEDVPDWVAAVLAATAPGVSTAAPDAAPPASPDAGAGGWAQVQRARSRTTGGRDLLGSLLEGPVWLRAPGGDTTVAAAVGRLGGLPVVGVAVAAELGGRPTPDGYRLLTRAARLADRLDSALVTLVDTPGAEPGTASEEGGIAPAMGEALDAVLLCRAPTLALLHGEGGSGGALAAAATDVLLVTADSYFAAIGPEGASAALRRPARECADLMGITPADLVRLGVADAVGTPADLAPRLAALREVDQSERLRLRLLRWSAPVPGTLRG
jgi:acetyl-CoA carboxylase carboxyltransferase component